MPDVAVRPIADEDVDLWVELSNAADPQLPSTAEGVRRAIDQERTIAHFLGYLDGRPVGAALCLEQGDLRNTDVAVAFFGVHPDDRRRGVGSALCGAVSEHARTLGKARLQVDCWEDEADALRFLKARGFVEVERFERVRLELDAAELPDASLPTGVEIVPFERCLQLAPQLYEIAEEAHADMPSTDPIEVSYDDWYGWEIRRETLRHDLGQVALADGRPIGFGSITVVGDSRTGLHSITAVARAWRRRGVATAIKRAQIEAARKAGLEALTTFSEMRNEPMRTLNARLGYRPLPSQLRLRGPLTD